MCNNSVQLSVTVFAILQCAPRASTSITHDLMSIRRNGRNNKTRNIKREKRDIRMSQTPFCTACFSSLTSTESMHFFTCCHVAPSPSHHSSTHLLVSGNLARTAMCTTLVNPTDAFVSPLLLTEKIRTYDTRVRLFFYAATVCPRSIFRKTRKLLVQRSL